MFDWLIRWRFLEELSVFLAMRSNGFYTIPSWSRSFTLMYINMFIKHCLMPIRLFPMASDGRDQFLSGQMAIFVRIHLF